MPKNAKNNTFFFGLGLMVFICSCGDTTRIITEKIRPGLAEEDPLISNEKSSIKALVKIRKTLDTSSTTLKTLHDDSQSSVQNADAEFKKISSLNLSEENHELTPEEAEPFFLFYQQYKNFIARISSSPVNDLKQQLSDLGDEAKSQRAIAPDTKDIDFLMAEILSKRDNAAALSKDIDDWEQSLNKKLQDLHAQIDDAGKNFSRLRADDRNALLNLLDPKIVDAKNLKDIKDILDDPQFFSLRQEIEETERGSLVASALDSIHEQIAGAEGIIEKARLEKLEIDNVFRLSDPQLALDNVLDGLALTQESKDELKFLLDQWSLPGSAERELTQACIRIGCQNITLPGGAFHALLSRRGLAANPTLTAQLDNLYDEIADPIGAPGVQRVALALRPAINAVFSRWAIPDVDVVTDLEPIYNNVGIFPVAPSLSEQQTLNEVFSHIRQRQEDLNKTAVDLDNKLETGDLSVVANQGGHNPAHLLMIQKLDEMFARVPPPPPPPPVGVAPPPPPPGGINPNLTLSLDENMTDFVDAIEEVQPPGDGAEIRVPDFNRAKNTTYPKAVNKILYWMPQERRDALEAEIKAAGTGADERYQASYQTLVDALQPLLPSELIQRLTDGQFLNGRTNELEFNKNFIKIFKPILNDELYGKILNAKDDQIGARMTFVVDTILNLPTFIALRDAQHRLETEGGMLEPNITGNLVRTACLREALTIDAYLGTPLPCATAINDFNNIKATIPPVSGHDRSASGARSKLVEKWFKGFIELQDALFKLKAKTATEIIVGGGNASFGVFGGMTALEELIESANNDIFSLAHQVDLTALPPDNEYTVQELIEDTNKRLSDIPIRAALSPTGVARNPEYSYDDLITTYEASLIAGMTGADIAALGRNLLNDVTNRHKLFYFHSVLSAQEYQRIMSPYQNSITRNQLLAKMKEAALGSLIDPALGPIGFADLKDAIANVRNADNRANAVTALNQLKAFFAPGDRWNELDQISAIQTKDMSSNFGLSGQLGSLKTVVIHNPQYLALKKLADVDRDLRTAVEDLSILPAAPPAGDSLEEIAGSGVFGSVGDHDIPSGLRFRIFGSRASAISVVTDFEALKSNLTLSINDLKDIRFFGPPLAKSNAVLQPIVNAFNLLFAYPLNALNALDFAVVSEQQIADIWSKIDPKYQGKFSHFLAVVGEKPFAAAATDPERSIITLLRALKAKIDAVPEPKSDTINDIDEFLRKTLLDR